jgi:hypothetical protein
MKRALTSIRTTPASHIISALRCTSHCSFFSLLESMLADSMLTTSSSLAFSTISKECADSADKVLQYHTINALNIFEITILTNLICM